MSKDWQIRLTDTIRYIGTIPSIPPASLAQLQPLAAQEWVSNLISLGGVQVFASPAETERRRALRGLLLCLVWTAVQDTIPAAKRHYQGASEAAIRDAIASFFPVANANAQTAVAATRRAAAPGAGGAVSAGNVFKYRRGAPETSGLVAHHACYESVNLWLYLGGVVSLRWLLAHGSQPAFSVPAQWSWGQPITSLADAATIRAGYFCRFHRPPGGTGLHYTLSTGGGHCVGNHNTAEIVVNWLHGYGPAPAPTISEFTIAGYLATTTSRVEQALKRKCSAQDLGLRIAPCVPSHPF
jgi:hypothetical protein